MNTKIFLIVLISLIILLRLVFLPMGSMDLATWIADGLYYLEHNSINRIDTYNVHQNLEFIYPGRLFNVFTAYLYKLTGYEFVIIFYRILLYSFYIYFLRYFILIKKIKINLKNISSLFIFGIGLTIFIDRPAMFGSMISVIIIQKLFKRDLSNKNIFFIATLTIIWANIHASVLILIPIIFYQIIQKYLLKSSTKNLYILMALVLICSIMTPEHINIYPYTIDTLFYSQQRRITEWVTPFSFQSLNLSLAYFLTVITYLYLLITNKENKMFLRSPIIPLLFLGLISIRHIVWPMIFLPFVMNQYDLWSKVETKYFKSKTLNLLIIIALLGVFPYQFKNASKNLGFDTDSPIQLTEEFLSLSKDLRIFNQWELGSYLILNQKNTIFIDSRNILFNKKIYQDYLTIINAKDNYIELLKKYKINALVLKRDQSPLSRIIIKNNNWKIAHQDELFTLIVDVNLNL